MPGEPLYFFKKAKENFLAKFIKEKEPEIKIEAFKQRTEELKKIVRVNKPDLKVLVVDSLTGNDAVSQAEEFDKYVNISGSILTKMDADAKGGAAISIVYVTKKPILFLGVGQRYEDIEPFKPDLLINRIFSKPN